MPYAIEFKGRTFTPDGQTGIKDVDAHNKALEAAELAHWALQPDRHSVYITDKGATTFLGAMLSVGPVSRNKIRSNMSRNMQTIRFRATNGAVYYGRYGADNSQLCRVRKAKS